MVKGIRSKIQTLPLFFPLQLLRLDFSMNYTLQIYKKIANSYEHVQYLQQKVSPLVNLEVRGSHSEHCLCDCSCDGKKRVRY